MFSMALQSPHLEMEFRPAPPGTETVHVVNNVEVPVEPAVKAFAALKAKFEGLQGFTLRVKTDIPARKGLGLSGATAVGFVVCANRYFKLGLNDRAIADFASKGEPSQHLDNVCASTFGGFNIAARDLAGQVHITTISSPKDLGLAIVVPDIEKSSTEATRRLIPTQIPVGEHVRSSGYAARIAAALAVGDMKTLLGALPWDNVVEPARADGGAYGRGVDSRYLMEEKRILLECFHVAETVSGAGPSRALWYSLSEEAKRGRRNKVGGIGPAVDLVTERLRSLGHEVQAVFITNPSSKGAGIK